MEQLSEEEVTSLIDILRNKFVDIPKIMSFVDANKASEFKKRN